MPGAHGGNRAGVPAFTDMRAATILVMSGRMVTAAEGGRGRHVAGARGEALSPSCAAPTVPEPGSAASGHGVSGVIALLRSRQPLAAEGIWRVSLAGEPGGRLVRHRQGGGWQLLQVDDLTDAQLEAYESGMQNPPQPAEPFAPAVPRNAR